MKTRNFRALSLKAVLAATLAVAAYPSFAQDAMLPEVLRPIQQQEVMDAINPDDFKDNLGNHIAERVLQMRGYDITGAGNVSGSSLSFGSAQVSGSVTAGSIVSANINANNGRITRIADPSAATDGVNLRTMQSAINAGRDNLGNHIATRVLVMDGNPIHTGSITGTDGSGNAIVSGGLLINSQTISGLAAPTAASHAANKGYVDAIRTEMNLGTVVRTVGDQTIDGSKTFVRVITARGGVNANNTKLTNVADATVAADAVNLRTMQTAIANAAGDNLGNHTATTTLNMSGNRVLNVGAPVANTDAVNKLYVDTRAGNYTGGSGINISGVNVISADSTVVRTSGAQTIAGGKTFNDTIDITSTNQLRLRNGNGGYGVILRNDGTGLHFLLTASGTPTAGFNSLRPLFINAANGGLTTETTLTVNGTSNSPDLVIRRTNSSVNANMQFFTTGTGDITIGQGDNGWFSVGSGDDITYAASGVFRVRASDGRIEWSGVAAGNGSGITSLNASNLASGTVNDARLPGSVVRTSRVINTGVGIDGGGDLSSNRTFSLTPNYHRRSSGSSDLGVIAYNGHDPAAGQFYGGTANPSATTRLNYNGNFFANRLWSTAYFYFSDRNLKKDIETIDGNKGLQTIMDLRPVSYRWKSTDEEALGVIAQEVQEVIPTAVIENEGGDLAVDYLQMIAPMIAAMQQMEMRIQSLEAELADLQP